MANVCLVGVGIGGEAVVVVVVVVGRAEVVILEFMASVIVVVAEVVLFVSFVSLHPVRKSVGWFVGCLRSGWCVHSRRSVFRFSRRRQIFFGTGHSSYFWRRTYMTGTVCVMDGWIDLRELDSEIVK